MSTSRLVRHDCGADAGLWVRCLLTAPANRSVLHHRGSSGTGHRHRYYQVMELLKVSQRMTSLTVRYALTLHISDTDPSPGRGDDELGARFTSAGLRWHAPPKKAQASARYRSLHHQHGRSWGGRGPMLDETGGRDVVNLKRVELRGLALS